MIQAGFKILIKMLFHKIKICILFIWQMPNWLANVFLHKIVLEFY